MKGGISVVADGWFDKVRNHGRRERI